MKEVKPKPRSVHDDGMKQTNIILIFATTIIFIWWIVLFTGNNIQEKRVIELQNKLQNLEQQNRMLELCALDVVDCKIINNK